MPAKFQQETLKSRFAQAKVLVVGDVMLDRYWFGDVSRISPEAPVPVAKIGRIDQRAGGAANVARNIASLGGKAGLLSVTGDDEAANALDALMVQDGVASYLMRDKQIATTVKLRVVARNQQLIRLDFEEHPNREVLEQIKRKYSEILPEYDAIIFSDYGKGGLSHISDMIDWAKHAGKTVLIDPKGDDYEKYAGATLITPNRAELKEVVGSWKNESELTEKAQNLRRHLDLTAVLLTRSEEGMTLFNEGEPIYHSPEPNAFATGASRNNSLIAVSTGLLDHMTRDEVKAVLAHEMAHVGNGDMVTLTLIQGVVNTFVVFLSRIIANLIARNNDGSQSQGTYFLVSMVFQILFGFLASLIVMWFSRQREYRADAGAAKLVGAPKMISALQRLKGNPVDLPKEMNAMGIAGDTRDSLLSTHPSLDNRIARLKSL